MDAFTGPIAKLLLLALLVLPIAHGQVNVVTNGGFEAGLTGWTAAPASGNGINTTCSFNATAAGGTETQTGTASLPPSSGTGLSIGSIKNLGSGAGAANSACALYQDVAIPAGASTATIAVRWGLIRLGTVSVSQAALLARLHSSTSTVPSYLTSGVGNITFYQPTSSDTTLAPATSASFNVSSLAGTTARLVLYIAQTAGSDIGRATVGAFDDVQLTVLVAPSISQSFGAASIPLNGTTSLTYTITNPASAGATATGIGFTNNLPAGVIVATPNGLSGTCGGGTIAATPGSGAVSLSGASLAPGAACTFSVNVTGTTAGTKNNSVSATGSSGTTNTATATLQVIGAPTVTSVSPSSGPLAGGTSVTITGTNLSGATAVTFGGIAATSFTAVNATTVTAVVPAGSAAGAVSVVVTTPSGSNAANTLYTYSPAPPTITSLSPNTGSVSGGTSVTITGTDFTGATAVTFGSTAATSFSVVNATTITATAPAATAGVVNVAVTTPSGTSASGGSSQFTYVALPVLSSLSPASGPVTGGTSITITGSAFTGATAVTFGSTPATGFSVVNDTTITATAPAASAGAVNVAVTTPSGTSAASGSSQYTYIVLPVISSLSPASGALAGGTAVTITGTGFTGATAVVFGSTPVASFTVASATTIMTVSPAGSIGAVNVAVTTPAGTSAAGASSQFVYGNLPVITGVTPSGGPLAGGTAVTITGANFTGATAVRFGTRAASSFAVLSDTTITAVAPELPAGPVDITVSTPAGTSAVTAAATYTARRPVPVDVPTLGEWAMIALGLMLAGAGYLAMRNRFA